jgi:hypothetical protein
VIHIFYNLIASVFGDNDKSKKIYKVYRCLRATVLCWFAIIVFFLAGISELTEAESIGSYFLGIIFCAIWIIMLRYIIKDKMVDLHDLPNLSGVDFKGGKLKFIQPFRERVCKITYKSGCEISVTFQDNEYTVTVKNQEWDVVSAASARNKTDLKAEIVKAIDCAVNDD